MAFGNAPFFSGGGFHFFVFYSKNEISHLGKSNFID
jgi:hypothetical protein